MPDPMTMRDEAMRLARQAGFTFRLESGPADVLLAKVGLTPATKPVEVDPARAKIELDVLDRLDKRGLRVPAMFAQ